jgi:hypothetical protein
VSGMLKKKQMQNKIETFIVSLLKKKVFTYSWRCDPLVFLYQSIKIRGVFKNVSTMNYVTHQRPVAEERSETKNERRRIIHL